jgi:hypothetical protein
MSADAVYAFYGIRWQFDANDAETENLLELSKHPHQLAAKANGLQNWWGRCAEGEYYYLLVGKMIAKLGAENQSSVRVDDSVLASIADETRTKLLSAGFSERAAMIFEFELG